MAYQPILQLSKIKTGVEIAKIDREISLVEQSKAELQITNAVEQYYYGILAVRKRKEAAQKNIEVAQLKLYDVQSILLAGKTVQANEVGLQAEIANEEQELLKLKFQEEDFVAELKQLTGIVTEELVLVETDTNIELRQSLEAYQSDATSNNTDIKLTTLQKEKSKLGLKATKQSYLPDFGIIAGYNYQYGADVLPSNNPFVGVLFKWDIQNLFGNKQVFAQRKLQQQQAAENETYTKKQTVISVEKVYRKMQQAEELITVARKAVNYRIAELRIKNDQKQTGLCTPIDVAVTEAELAKSQADLYGAIMSYKITFAELRLLTEKK